MRVLALDTTTRAGSIAVIDAGQVLVERSGNASRTHAERLPAEALEAIAAAGTTLSGIDLFAVASGPGSFTGLRIGIACVQGLAFVTGKRVAPISALRALAEVAASTRGVGARVGAWMDAHRNDVFSALYEVAGDDDGGGVKRLVEIEAPMVSRPAATIERWRTAGLPASICGDGATLYQSLVPEPIAVIPMPLLAGTLGRLAIAADRSGATVLPAGVQPLYVRRPDAEVARDAALKR